MGSSKPPFPPTPPLRSPMLTSFSLEYVSNISSCRETLFSVLSKSNNLQRLLNVSARDARETEVRTLLFASSLSRHHHASQSALKIATYLAQIVQPCKDLGLNVDAAVQYEGSNVLWDQNEMSASIRMLEGLIRNTDMLSQHIHVSTSELLAKLVCNWFTVCFVDIEYFLGTSNIGSTSGEAGRDNCELSDARNRRTAWHYRRC